MVAWSFRVWLSGDPDDLIELSNKLFDAGCDDSTPGSFEGSCHTDFHREADSLHQAIRTAVADVHKAGHTVDRIEIPHDEVSAWPR